MRKILLFIALLSAFTLQVEAGRWTVSGNHSVSWDTSKGELPYADHIEMSASVPP